MNPRLKSFFIISSLQTLYVDAEMRPTAALEDWGLMCTEVEELEDESRSPITNIGLLAEIFSFPNFPLVGSYPLERFPEACDENYESYKITRIPRNF